MQKFLDRLEEMRLHWGDEVIGVQPFVYKVDAEVILLNEDVLSIKQTVYICLDGPSSTLNFGSTFDLNTGERMPFTDIVDISANEFRSSLASELINLQTSNKVIERINTYYGPNVENNYDVYYDLYYDDTYPINYEYFYDGEFFYFEEILGIGEINSAELIRWNGETGEEFQVELVELQICD